MQMFQFACYNVVCQIQSAALLLKSLCFTWGCSVHARLLCIFLHICIYIYTRTHVYNTHMYFYIDVYIHICIFTYMFGMHVLVHWRVVPRMTLALLHIAWCNAAKKSLYQLNHKANVCMSCVAHAQDRRAHTMYFYEQIEFYVIAF